MSLDVLLLVLLGALLHAGWNALVKSGADKALDASLVAAGAAACSIPFIPFLPMPGSAALPFLVLSAVLQFTYFRLVAAAYTVGDIGLVYPIMRGVAPLIVAASSNLFLGETLSAAAIAGIAIISSGILTLALEARSGGRWPILLALANSVVIAGYTFVDGVGARLSTSPLSYTLWMSLLPPLMLFSWAFYQRGWQPVAAHVRRHWFRGLAGGAGSILSYGLALWAMTKAPVAVVAALRETSILFAIVISVVILNEKASLWRYVAGGVIALGVLTMRLG
ncbi:EamA family transporter [Agrobacterium sp. CG674]